MLCCPGKIDQLFLNLLLNAIQACEPRRAWSTAADPRRPGRGGVVVEVSDDGRGIAPEHLPHIFEPFFTTKPVGQGKGLGLSVSYGIVRDHGGTIEVESAPGRGSVFRVRLPSQPARNPRPAPGRLHDLSGGSSEPDRRVLLRPARFLAKLFPS